MKHFLRVIILFIVVAQWLSCAHMSGQRYKRDSSHPKKPRWLSTIPQSSRYQYFVGISSEQAQLDEAKKEAIMDAFNDAISIQGVEVSIKYEQLNTEERSSFKDNITVGGASRLGLELVSWYWELWEIYFEKKVTPRYRAFVLMRSKKLNPDPWYKVAVKNLGQRFECTWHSLLIPGWGQMRLRKTGKGRLFLLSELVSLSGYGYFYYMYETTEDEYEKILFQISKTRNETTLNKLEMSRFNLNRDLNNFRHYRNQLFYASAGIYILNLIDAFVFGYSSADDIATNYSERKIYWSALLKKNNMMLHLKIHF